MILKTNTIPNNTGKQLNAGISALTGKGSCVYNTISASDLRAERESHYFDEPKLAPWVTLSVQGFADSPVSCRENEHGFPKGGERLYNFVIFNNQDYWLQMAVEANDDCPP